MSAANVLLYQSPVYEHQDLPHEPLTEIRKRECRAMTSPLFVAFNPVPDELREMQRSVETRYLNFSGRKDDHQC